MSRPLGPQWLVGPRPFLFGAELKGRLQAELGRTPMLPLLREPLQKGLFLFFQPRARPHTGRASKWLLNNPARGRAQVDASSWLLRGHLKHMPSV